MVWWIMYCPSAIEYSDVPICLGKYPGPAIDVGLAMTTKTLHHNGEVVYQSTYRPLIVEE